MTRTYTLPASISALDALIGELAYIVRYLYYMLLRVFGWPINPIRLTDLSGINPLVDMLVFVGRVILFCTFSLQSRISLSGHTPKLRPKYTT